MEAKKKRYRVERVVLLNSFDTQQEAKDWLKKFFKKGLDDGPEITFQVTDKTHYGKCNKMS